MSTATKSKVQAAAEKIADLLVKGTKEEDLKNHLSGFEQSIWARYPKEVRKLADNWRKQIQEEQDMLSEEGKFMLKHLQQLEGMVIVGVSVSPANPEEYQDDDFFCLRLRKKGSRSDKNDLLAWILRDPEGNGSGFLDIVTERTGEPCRG